MLLLRVMTVAASGAETCLGQRCVPVTLLMPGCRSVYLLDAKNRVVPESSLLVSIKVKPPPAAS